MLRTLFVALFFLCSNTAFADSSEQTTAPPKLEVLLTELPKTSLRDMPVFLDKLAATKDPRLADLYSYIVNSELYYIKSSKVIVRAVRNADKKYDLTQVVDGKTLPAVTKTTLAKVRTNNSVRSKVRGLIAQLDLTSDDKTTRLSAVKQLIAKPNSVGLETVAGLIEQEQNGEVKELMNVLLMLEQLKQDDQAGKLSAISLLQESLEPKVLNELNAQLEASLETTGEGEKVNHELNNALTKAIDKIDQKREMFGVAENLFFGLSLGSVLLLSAIGLAITFGVMGVINMAHGEMMMLGAYTTYVIQQAFPNLIEYSLFMAIPAAFLVSGLVGIAIERGVIQFLKGRPLETLLATFGISLILQQLVRSIFSPLNRQVSTPQWMSGSLEINPVFSITYNRLYIVIFALVVFFALMAFMKKSSLGLHVRAVAQNRDMARSLSIRSNWVDAVTFGLGSGIAGVAGVVLSQLTNVGPNLGQAYIIDSFLVVVFGGVGNLWGTLVAAMSLGSVNKFLEPITGSVLANIIVLVGLVLFIQKRPKGLFPQKGRAAD